MNPLSVEQQVRLQIVIAKVDPEDYDAAFAFVMGPKVTIQPVSSIIDLKAN